MWSSIGYYTSVHLTAGRHLPFLFLDILDRATAPAQTKIYVGNVEPHITTEMIKTVFEPFGMVVGAEMVADPNNPGNVS